MSQRKLKDWIESFLDFTDNTEPCENYRRWCAISSIASVLQRKCWLHWGSETFYPNLYIVLVGPPAARKGTAMRVGKELLDELGMAVAADESSRQKLVQALMDCRATEQTEEGELNLHSSMTIFSTELTVFLGYESKEMISMLCKWYDCESRFIYDTVSRGKEEVPNVWINLLGGTTPGQLQAALPSGAIGSGFTSRIVFVYAENKGKMVLKPTLKEQIRGPLLRDLEDIRAISGAFTLEEDAEQTYYEWRTESEEHQVFTDPRLEYYVQRRPTHLFKMAMIHSAARGNDRTVTLEDMARAIGVLQITEKDMEETFAGIGTNPLAATQHRLRRFLQKHHNSTLESLAEMVSDDVTFSQTSECLNALQQMGYIQMDTMGREIKYIKGEEDAS